jgi:peroxiredoxin/predicted 2-oxoglutarate/Fe(II)-dependent dioxygenase YbiX
MPGQDSFLEAGDRAPNFILTDQNEEQFELYITMSGGPIVLVLVSSGDELTTQLLSAFEKRLPDFKTLSADLFVVSDATQDVNATLAMELALHFPLVADPDGSVTHWFLSSSGTRAPVAFILDPNQRLAAIEKGGDRDGGENGGDLPARALAAVQKIAPKGTPGCFSAVAPVLIVPNVFSPDTCRRLIEVWKTREHFTGKVQAAATDGTVQEIDYGMKRRKDHLIREPALESEIVNILGPRIGPEVYKVYYYDEWTFEGFRVGCYEASDSGFFKAHRDNFNEAVKNRRYAITINLNADDYEGGDLRFPEYGQDLYRPPTGGAIIFSCSLLHEIVPMTKGRRFTFLTFLISPPEQTA